MPVFTKKSLPGSVLRQQKGGITTWGELPATVVNVDGRTAAWCWAPHTPEMSTFAEFTNAQQYHVPSGYLTYYT